MSAVTDCDPCRALLFISNQMHHRTDQSVSLSLTVGSVDQIRNLMIRIDSTVFMVPCHIASVLPTHIAYLNICDRQANLGSTRFTLDCSKMTKRFRVNVWFAVKLKAKSMISLTRHRKANRLDPYLLLFSLCLYFMTKNKNVT